MLILILFTLFLHIVWIRIFTYFLHTDVRSFYFFGAGIVANLLIITWAIHAGENTSMQYMVPIAEELLKWFTFLPALWYLQIFSSEKSLISIVLIIATGFSLSEALLYVWHFSDNIPQTVLIVKNMSGIIAHNVFSSITATGTIFAVYELYRHIDHHDAWVSTMMRISRKLHISPEWNLRLYRTSIIISYLILGSLVHMFYNVLIRSLWFQFFPLRTLIMTLLISCIWYFAHQILVDQTLKKKYGNLMGRIQHAIPRKGQNH